MSRKTKRMLAEECVSLLDKTTPPDSRHCLYAAKKVQTFFHWGAPPPRPPKIVGLRPPRYYRHFLYKSINRGGRRPTYWGSPGGRSPPGKKRKRGCTNFAGYSLLNNIPIKKLPLHILTHRLCVRWWGPPRFRYILCLIRGGPSAFPMYSLPDSWRAPRVSDEFSA